MLMIQAQAAELRDALGVLLASIGPTSVRRPQRTLAMGAEVSAVALLLAVTVVLFSSCAGGGEAPPSSSAISSQAGETPNPSEISLQGTVTQSVRGWPMQSSYHVSLQVRNSGKNPIIFDMAEGAFLTQHGDAVRGKTTREPDGWELAPSDEETFPYETADRTREFLRAANGGPLYFEFTLFAEEGVVAGPFRALLPELGGLPLYQPSLAGQEGERLEFKDAQGQPVPVP